MGGERGSGWARRGPGRRGRQSRGAVALRGCWGAGSVSRRPRADGPVLRGGLHARTAHGFPSGAARPAAGQVSGAGPVAGLRGCLVAGVPKRLTSPPQAPAPTGSTGWPALWPPASEEPRWAPQTPGARGQEPSPRPWVSGPGEACTARGRTRLQGGAPAEPTPQDWVRRARLSMDS